MKRYRPIQFARDADGEQEGGSPRQSQSDGTKTDKTSKGKQKNEAQAGNPFNVFVSKVVWRFATTSPMFDMILDIKKEAEATPDMIKTIWTTEKEVRNYAQNLIGIATKNDFKKKASEYLTKLVKSMDIIRAKYNELNRDRTGEPEKHLPQDVSDAIKSACHCIGQLVKALMSYIWMGKVPQKFSTFQRYSKLQQYDPEVVKVAAWYYSLVDKEAQITDLCNLHPKSILGKIGRTARKYKHDEKRDWENVDFSRRRMRRGISTRRRRYSNFTSTNRTKHEYTTNKLYQRPRRYKTR